MITKEQREASFREELEHLLKKYEAEIDIVMEGRDYIQTPHIEISMWAVFDHQGNLSSEMAEFKL
jgi:predicted nucleotide-binding protein (sugar kinase/HSP70/actin superfamily)